MITVRQIQRVWDDRGYDRLTAELLTLRVEDSARLRGLLSGSLPAAALGLIRLDELNQAHNPLAGKFVRRILASQTSDGGWDDPLTTALCVRALLTCNGHGPAIDRAIGHLSDLQKPEGAWPKEPIRRLAADGYTTVFVLFALGGHELVRRAIRFRGALSWVHAHESELDPSARKLWAYAAMCVDAPTTPPSHVAMRAVRPQQPMIWS